MIARIEMSGNRYVGESVVSTDRTLVGVDGCRGGWMAIIALGDRLEARIVPDWVDLMNELSAGAQVGVDIPIGLPARGARQCDLEARRYLGLPRGSSVFPAPVRSCLEEGAYAQLSARHRSIDGRGLTRQAFHLLPKIREVDRYVSAELPRQKSISEVHPEVSFALWNSGNAMSHNKARSPGQAEREALIEAEWPGERERLWAAVRRKGCGRDDLNDAFAALWTVQRIVAGRAIRMPQVVAFDERGVRMEIVA